MSKAFSRVVLFVLSWLGLSSCITTPRAEYGCPHATFLLDGTVVDVDTGEPLQGIEIRFQEHITYSDGSSNWVISKEGVPFPATYFIVATDIDGAENGGFFDPDTVWIDPTKTEPGIGWYAGTFEQHDIVIELDKAEQ